ncbi:MAG: IS200/IS605 family transposase [Planctomycetes bacterium]|nr:IS200/IS605 family transposase [Planctomycetota bacterium]
MERSATPGKLHYHLVFSTKHRLPRITAQMQPRLGEYLGGIVRDHGGIPIQIGGVDDHVHLLVTLRQEPALKDVLREIKSGSSGWVHETFPDANDFWWQTGYGAFTVSHSNIDDVKRYIANQAEHHKKMSFQDELRALFRKHGIDFDETYLWE